MTTLFIVAGTKGGIGKTLTASFLADAALDLKRNVRLYDCDNENPSFSASFSRITQVRMIDPDSEEMDFPLDVVINSISSQAKANEAFIVDMKAGTSRQTLNWLEFIPFEELKEAGIRTVVVGVITAEIDSIITLTNWINHCSEAMNKDLLQIAVVKNLVSGTDFKFFEENLAHLVRQTPGYAEVELPKLTWHYLSMCRKSSASLGQWVRNITKWPELTFMDRTRIRKQYEQAAVGFRSLVDDKAKNDGKRTKSS